MGRGRGKADIGEATRGEDNRGLNDILKEFGFYPESNEIQRVLSR